MHTITKYFPNLSNLQRRQFFRLKDLYLEWNNKINLISRRDIDNLYINHILHSLSIAKFIQFNKNSRILDIGTGGGFPGIPLAIMFPEVEFLLVDSIAKKIRVVNDISQDIGLTNLIAEHNRVEQVEGNFDFIVARAVAKLKTIQGWIGDKISTNPMHDIPNGIICLKGGNLENELISIENIEVLDISDYFEEEFFETKKIVYIRY